MYPIVISVGVKEEDRVLVTKCLENDCTVPDVFLIDIAHGHSVSVIEMIKFIRSCCADKVDIIAGNICTKDAALRLCDLNINALRVGIGGSLVCSTRCTTGFGAPTLQSIIDCYEATQNYNVPIIADGGFKTSGDIVKALSFGAETVSLGTLLASTLDSPGDRIEIDNRQFKKVYGMASKECQEIHRDGLKPGTAPEGKTVLLPYKGKTTDVLSELLGGIRSGLTYAGAKNLEELRDNAEYVILGSGGIVESKFV